MTKRVVLFSGGVGSWAAAKRVVEQHGIDNLTLLFTDTLTEDEDLYRFLREGAGNVGGALVWLKEGRNIWDVFRDGKMLGNSRLDPCSRVLKREPARRWIEDNCDARDSVIYIGIDWSEIHRYERMRERWLPFKIEAPLCQPPYLTKQQVFAWLKAEGIRRPRLYDLGLPHNNCGGGCVKAGQAQWRHLLRVAPERYAEWERNEQAIRTHLGDVAILRHRSGPQEGRPLTLAALRITTPDNQAEFDWGGCGCMVDDDEG